MNRIFYTFAVLLAVMIAAPAFGQADIKQRMMQRLPAVEALKKSGAVGENNKGLLEPRAALSGSDAAVVKAENDDRKRLYGSIASKVEGISAEEVGKRRALEIVRNSKGGVWVQKPNGDWFKAP